VDAKLTGLFAFAVRRTVPIVPRLTLAISAKGVEIAVLGAVSDSLATEA